MLFQKATNCSMKDHISHCKKPSFESQYTAFRNGLDFIRFYTPSSSRILLSEIRDKDGCPLLQQAEVTDFSIPSFDTSAAIPSLSIPLSPLFHAHIMRIEYLLIVRIPCRHTMHSVYACAVGLFGCDNPQLGHLVKQPRNGLLVIA